MNILVLNAGSSTQKSRLYSLSRSSLSTDPPPAAWSGDIDWTAEGLGTFTVASPASKRTEVVRGDRRQALEKVLATMFAGDTAVVEDPSEIDIVGHRVVHGGARYTMPAVISAGVKDEIRALGALAPAHNPVQLAGIETAEALFEGVPQLAVFDTAFHQNMPPAEKIYPIPYEWFEKGVRRFGFHGTSHKYCAERAAHLLRTPLEDLGIIVCHLGHGCSLAAVRGGVSIATTMGFTPLEGLMMGTRSGSIDPGILIHLMGEHGLTVNQLDEMLNLHSGLKGISGVSGDMRAVLEAAGEGHERARLALEAYVGRLRKAIGSMAVDLGGLDALVFTAGVGEHAAQVREAVCDGLEFLGLTLDHGRNTSHPRDEDIAAADSRVRVLVIHSEEDWAIARECWRHLTVKDTPPVP